MFAHYSSLSADSGLVDTVSDEFKLLQDYLIKSHGHTHHLSFQVQICSPPLFSKL